MQLISYFLKKFRFLLLFVFLEISALILTIQHHSYHTSEIVNSSNFITGSFYSKIDNVNQYFHLKSENARLLEENTQLKNWIENNNSNRLKKDSSSSQYNYKFARVIKNSYFKLNNILTINKGEKQGIKRDMAVINSKGIIGVIKNTSSNFSTVLSVLSNQFKVNVKFKNSNYFGSLTWNGKDYNIVQIEDIPRQTKFFIGDTVVVGNSAIFPEGILVGTIKDFKIKNNSYQQINVNLFNDMSALGYVKVIENKYKEEQINLENLSDE